MDAESGSPAKPRLKPTRFFLRGLAISLPGVLTLVILIWIADGINTYIVSPASWTVRRIIAEVIDSSVPLNGNSPRLVRLPNGPPLDFVGRNYLVTEKLKADFDSFLKGRIDDLSRKRVGGPGSAGQRPPAVPADQEHAPEVSAEELSDEPTARLTGPQLLDVMQVEEQARAQWLEARALDPDFVGDSSADVFVVLNRGVPFDVFATVARRLPAADLPTSATGVYMDYAAEKFFGSQFLLSAAAVSLIVVLLYFLGRFVNARIGGWMVSKVESDLLGRLPLVRNVYGSAKQVTEFLFSENQVEYRRVVAIEYPRRGIWSLGFVTGESMLDITAAVGEPCVSILVPSSPMPVTGYTMCVPRSALLDLNISVDQAFQFCISCGVLVPPNQKVTPELLQRELTRRLTERMRDSNPERRPIAVLNSEASGSPRPGAENDAASQRTHPEFPSRE
ncbi:MAG: DUF502 domain-containing protein [Planctomycetaceae bacterium]|nr:DUF502 domain-containing protein [Planctomycetaceae bacterium]